MSQGQTAEQKNETKQNRNQRRNNQIHILKNISMAIIGRPDWRHCRSRQGAIWNGSSDKIDGNCTLNFNNGCGNKEGKLLVNH